MTVRCFYHSADLDGHCSGAIVRMMHPEVVLYPINYGDDFPWAEVRPDDEVFMVDFCLQPFELMVKLNDMCRLIWIDHHKSAIDSHLRSTCFPLLGLFDTELAGCELTWKYFEIRRRTQLHPAFTSSMPNAVRLLGRYDVWDKCSPEVDWFQWGMRAESDTRPEASIWESLLHRDRDKEEELIAKGKVLVRYQETQDERYCRGYAFEAVLDEMKVIAVNRGMINSSAFKSVWNPSRHDAMCAFVKGKKHGVWKITLYTDKPGIDLGKFCKLHGGGGHAQAAGYQLYRCPF